MEKFYIRRSVNGKTFAASVDPGFPGLGQRKCPMTGEAFEQLVKEVNTDKAEIMGINFQEVVNGIGPDGLYFGRFRISLGETMIIQ